MKYAIIGFPKCGTVSLENKLIEEYGKENVIRIVPELIWNNKGPKIMMEQYKDYTPVIITRDPADRIWSAFKYYTQFKRMWFEKFLRGNNVRYKSIGCYQPIYQSDYNMYISRFKDPIVYSLEELQQDPDFPHENKTKRKKMPQKYRDLVNRAINGIQS